uniref:E3 ubiquitin-protein ligase n=1 Tax=Marseillevirus LCMAC103 TaxID=2506604 RepID=A0A481YV90_9VIRU|nr:MAG: E3 ubiquitin-protein ligase [Marseillevirus LCMAC103]
MSSYRTHCKRVALDREKSKIPETLAALPQLREQEQAREEAKAYLVELGVQRAILDETIAATGRIADGSGTAGTSGKTARRGTFLCPCPANNCRGMIEAASSRCGICDQRVCPKCWGPPREAEEKHVCNAADLETIQMLRKDSKPCPNCAVPIHRISGCNQMWCTHCRTGYNWNTGALSRGPIHNPHALRWYRDHGGGARAPEDVPCGELVQMHHLGLTRLHARKLEKTYQAVAEVDEKLARHRQALLAFDDLRLQYVLRELSEKQWQQKIFLRERANARAQATIDILATFQTLALERLRRLHEALNALRRPDEKEDDDSDDPFMGWKERIERNAVRSRSRVVRKAAYEKVVTTFVTEMGAIRLFVNDAFTDELAALGMKTPLQIDSEWNWSDRRVRRGRCGRRNRRYR